MLSADDVKAILTVLTDILFVLNEQYLDCACRTVSYVWNFILLIATLGLELRILFKIIG